MGGGQTVRLAKLGFVHFQIIAQPPRIFFSRSLSPFSIYKRQDAPNSVSPSSPRQTAFSMSALHLDIQGLHLFDRVADSDTACTSLRTNEYDEGHAYILERVARLTLSPSRLHSRLDMDDAQRSAARRILSPPSSPPFSDNATTFEDTSEATESLASLSPAPSLYSLTDSIREASIRIEYGRGINTTSDVYRIAADDQETDRLGKSMELPNHSTVFNFLQIGNT